MTGDETQVPDTAALLRQRALARWDNEGGAMASGPQEGQGSAEKAISSPAMTDAKFDGIAQPRDLRGESSDLTTCHRNRATT